MDTPENKNRQLASRSIVKPYIDNLSRQFIPKVNSMNAAYVLVSVTSLLVVLIGVTT